jgi:hypothetical protein
MKTLGNKCIFSIALLGMMFSAASHAYIIGGANSSLTPGSGNWSWDGSYLTDFRGALENPAFFGPSGIVDETITTVDLASITAATLSGVDMFIAPWVKDNDGSAFNTEIMNFFLGGGDLFVLQDSSGWDIIGDTLGIATTASSGSVSNGGSPFFDGAFGIANDVTQHYQVGQLDPAAISAQNGQAIGTNVEGQVTSAYWAPGDYAAGAGALFIIADVDMIASTTFCGLAECGAIYGPTLADLNDNAVYALNTFSFIQSGGVLPVPEPAPIVLMGVGLLALFLSRRKTKITRP